MNGEPGRGAAEDNAGSDGEAGKAGPAPAADSLDALVHALVAWLGARGAQATTTWAIARLEARLFQRLLPVVTILALLALLLGGMLIAGTALLVHAALTVLFGNPWLAAITFLAALALALAATLRALLGYLERMRFAVTRRALAAAAPNAASKPEDDPHGARADASPATP